MRLSRGHWLGAPRHGVRAALGLAAIVLLLFWDAVVGGGVFFKRDIHSIWLPQVEAFRRAVADGSWPTWDPLAAFGQPLLADPSAQVLYPFTWLNLLMRPWTYYTVFVVSHLWLSGVGLYALARRWGMSPVAGFVAAGLWIAGGPLQSYVDLWHHFAGACWMPWVFLAADRALAERSARATLIWGATIAGQILAGSADMCAMTALGVVAYLGVEHVRWRRGPPGVARHSVLIAGAAVIFALSLSAPLWLPALDLVGRSARGALPSEVRTFWSLHPASLLDLVFPNVWTPLLAQPAALFLREIREPFLDSVYLGLPALGLVAAALAGGPRRVRWLLLVLGVTGLLLSLGRHTPAYDVLLALLPPLRILRYPMKAVIVVGFAWALLAGMGSDVLQQKRAERGRGWRLAVVAPLALLGVAAAAALVLIRLDVASAWLPRRSVGLLPYSELLPATAQRLGVSGALAAASLFLVLLQQRGARWAAAGLALLALGDLAVYHRYLALAPTALLAVRPQVATILAATGDPRVYAYDYEAASEYVRRFGTPYRLARRPRDWSTDAANALGQQLALAHAAAGRWALRTSYEPDFRGLQPRALAGLATLLRRVEGSPSWIKLLRMGGVSHVVALHAWGFEDLVAVATLPGPFREPVRLWAVPHALPRAYVMAATRALSEPAALARLLEPDWDPRNELILPEGEPSLAAAAPAGWARVSEERSDRLAIEAELTEAGYLVLIDTFEPGWHASVDGRPAPILPANIAFRAVRLPAGRHVVKFSYRPPWLGVGLVLSATALAAGLGAALAFGRAGAPRADPARPA